MLLSFIFFLSSFYLSVISKFYKINFVILQKKKKKHSKSGFGGFIKIFIYLAALSLSYSMWNLVPCPEIDPRLSVLGVQS